jgi:hypothetical protein
MILKKACKNRLFGVDLAGIEPASEILSLVVSPITAASLHSLRYAAGSSLIASVASSYACMLKALHTSFPVIIIPGTGGTGTTGRQAALRLLLQQYCCQRLNLSSGYIAVRPADGCPDFKNPVETSTSPFQETPLLVSWHLHPYDNHKNSLLSNTQTASAQVLLLKFL